MDTDLMVALQLGQLQAGFLGQTAHELRSPMSHLMSLQQLILADLCEDPAEEREFLAQCYAASQKFMELLDLAINVSKLDYGRSQLQQKSFDLRSVITELEQLLIVKAKNRNLSLHIAHPSQTPDLIGDRQRVQQFFLTLLNTTVQQTEAGDIHFSYDLSSTGEVTFQLRSPAERDFWEKMQLETLALSDKPTLAEVKQLAQSFEFSPALKWQLCQKLITSLHGTLNRDRQGGFIQVTGQLPLGNRK